MTARGRPAAGLAVFPDQAFLRAARGPIEAGLTLELSPELWWRDARTPDVERRDAMANLAHRAAAAGARVVAHGVAACLGEPPDPARDAAWEARLRADQAAFGFSRWSEHLAFAAGGGLFAGLPLPLPDLPGAAAIAAARLRRLAEVTGVPVALEPVACPFRLCAPEREAALATEVAAAAGCDLVLDLHNAWAGEQSGGLSLEGWLAATDLERVVEVHLAGGRPSDPALLASGRTVWLDSHDALVPEPVWAALERLLPRCPRLEAVVLERVPDALGPAERPAWEAELSRLRALCPGPSFPARAAPARAPAPPAPAPALDPAAQAEVEALNAAVVRALHARDPATALDVAGLTPAARAAVGHADPDGLRVAGLLVKKLRFERLLLGAPALRADFERDPAGFVERFRRHDAAVPAAAWPADEVERFRAFEAGGP